MHDNIIRVLLEYVTALALGRFKRCLLCLAGGNEAAKTSVAKLTGASESGSSRRSESATAATSVNGSSLAEGSHAARGLPPASSHGPDSDSHSAAAHFAEFYQLSKNMVLPTSEHALVNSIFAVGLADVLNPLREKSQEVQFKGYDGSSGSLLFEYK